MDEWEWLRSVDPAAAERERFAASPALRDEAPGCAADRARREMWRADNLAMRGRAVDIEMAHSKRKNGQMAFYGRQGMQVTFARAQAELDAAPELEVWLNCKAEYHYADDTARALRSKVMAMLNINKSVTSQFSAYRG